MQTLVNAWFLTFLNLVASHYRPHPRLGRTSIPSQSPLLRHNCRHIATSQRQEQVFQEQVWAPARLPADVSVIGTVRLGYLGIWQSQCNLLACESLPRSSHVMSRISMSQTRGLIILQHCLGFLSRVAMEISFIPVLRLVWHWMPAHEWIRRSSFFSFYSKVM